MVDTGGRYRAKGGPLPRWLLDIPDRQSVAELYSAFRVVLMAVKARILSGYLVSDSIATLSWLDNHPVQGERGVKKVLHKLYALLDTEQSYFYGLAYIDGGSAEPG